MTLDRDWPAWAAEPVRLAQPDPHWRVTGPALAAAVQRLLPRLVRRIAHVGSTAVPGLTAKPVLDLLADVADPSAAVPEIDRVLGPLGWSLIPPDLNDGTYCWVLPRQDRRIAHLHTVASEDPRFAAMLRFRDRLRADPDLARRYAALKRDLAAQHPDDREAYTAAKAEFVIRVVNDDGPVVLGPGR